MARRIAALTFGLLGQSLEMLCRRGRPASATFEVHRQFALDEGTPEFQGAASVDAPNTTLNGSAGPAQADPNRIPLTSTAGLAKDKRYRISQNELDEWPEIGEIGAGYVRAKQPLQNDYTTGATFQSAYLTAAVDATFIQSLSNLSDLLDTTPDYRVVWTITIGGVVQPTVYTFFDVVRTPLAHDVDINDLDNAIPGLLDNLPVQHRSDQGRRMLDRAWLDVRADLVKNGIDVNALRDDEVIDQLVLRRAIMNLAEGGWAPAGMDKERYLERASERYDRFIEQHIQVVLQHATASREGGTHTEEPNRTFWRK